MSVFFFFSSRRRHTRWPRDWSSDVCSSDLSPPYRWPGRSSPGRSPTTASRSATPWSQRRSRSEERRVGKSVDLGGGRVIKKKKMENSGVERRRRDEGERDEGGEVQQCW